MRIHLALMLFGLLTACGDDTTGSGGSGAGASGASGGAGGQGGSTTVGGGGTGGAPGALDWSLQLRASESLYASAPRLDEVTGDYLSVGRVWGDLEVGSFMLSGNVWDPFLLRIGADGSAKALTRFESQALNDGPHYAGSPVGLPGGVAFAGSLRGPVLFGSGAAGLLSADESLPTGYVVRTNDDGGVPWHVLVDNGVQSYVSGLTATPHGLYLIGSCEDVIDIGMGAVDCGFTRDWLVARIDPDTGVVEANVHFGGPVNTDIGADIAALPGGGVVVTGTGFGSVDFGGGVVA
jgi:hypothetical protein